MTGRRTGASPDAIAPIHRGPARDGQIGPSRPAAVVSAAHRDIAAMLPAECVRVLVSLDRRESPPAAVRDAYDFHRRLRGYEPTPLRNAAPLAAQLGIKQVWIKEESCRFELPAFKILGVSWAAYRAILARLRIERDPEWGLDQLASAVRADGSLRLAAPTDGNHGQAVARVARMLGLQAHIFVPANTVEARVRAIREEGASVETVDGGFDHAVAAAAAAASTDRDALLLADTTTGVNDDVARWVIEGYQTIGWELATQLASTPDVVVVPIGVGGLAAAIGRTLAATPDGGPRPLLVGVEPLEAASTMASVAAGRVLTLPGPTESIMAGLSCGTPSAAAWPTVLAAYDLYVAVGPETARLGMRALKQLGMEGGECSGGVVGALLQLAGRAQGLLALSPETTVLLLATEGVTDPDNFEALVGDP